MHFSIVRQKKFAMPRVVARQSDKLYKQSTHFLSDYGRWSLFWLTFDTVAHTIWYHVYSERQKEFVVILYKRFELNKCISNLKDTDCIILQGTLYTQ